MIDGRAGKPRSHRWYLVRNESIPEWAESRADQAAPAAADRCGHPGPFKKQFRGPDGACAIDFIGTGGQAAVPPSRHRSGEVRCWEGGDRGEPATVGFPALWQAVGSLARAVGAAVPEVGPGAAPPDAPHPNCEAVAGPASAPDPTAAGVNENPHALTDPAALAEAERRARAYAGRVGRDDPPRSGHGGDAKTYRTLKALLFGFRLPVGVAYRVFRDEINDRLKPVNDAWEDAEIVRKIGRGVAEGPSPEHPVGDLLDATPGGAPAAWDDPNRLARAYLSHQPAVAVKDTVFLYGGGAYTPASPGWLAADIRRHCLVAAEDEFRRRQRQHDADAADAGRRVAELGGKFDAAGHDEERELWRRERTAAAREAVRLKKKGRPAVAPAVTNALINEMTAAVKAQAQRPDGTEPFTWLVPGDGGRLIPVANGLLDLETSTLRPHSPDYFAAVVLPVAFDPAAPEPLNFLATVERLMEGDAARIAVLQEVMGACLDPGLTLKFFAAMVGPGDNGKSVILTVLTAVLGAANVSAVSLDRLAAERFAAWEMFGKLANLCGDQSYFDSKDEGRLKTFTGGDRVTFEQKGRDPFSAVNTAKLIFACNALPTFADKSEAVWNRLIAVPFEWTVPADKKNPAMLTPAFWRPELPGVLNWMVEGLRRLRASRGFATSEKCDALKGQHRRQSDPVRLFFEEQVEAGKLVADPNGFLSSADANALYDTYRVWCDAAGYAHKLNRLAFGRSVGRCFPNARNTTTTRAGVSVRGWQGVRSGLAR